NFSLNPFARVLAELTASQRRRLVDRQFDYADPGTGIGPFNLKLALGASTQERSITGEHASKAKIKPFAIESCFGYWVPSKVSTALDNSLGRAGQGKRRDLKNLLSKLEAMAPATLRKRYERYLHQVAAVLREI